MGVLAIICDDEELPEAAQQFAAFEDLDVRIERVTTLDALNDIEDLEGLIFQGPSQVWRSLDMIRRLRAGEKNSFLPVLIFLPELTNYYRAVCFDLEYVLPCSLPPQSFDLVPSLKKIVWFSRKKKSLLERRAHIEGALRKRQYETVGPMLDEFLAEEKDAFRTHLVRARLALEKRELKAAVEFAMAAVKENNRSLEARILLAHIYMENNSLEKAQEVITKSLAMAPEHPAFISMAGRLALLGGKIEDAAQIFAKSLKIDGGQQGALAGLIATDILLDRPADAKKRIMRDDPFLIRQLHAHVMDLARLKRLGEAEKVMHQGIKLLPTQKEAYKVWLTMGMHAKRQHNLKKALVYFRNSAAVAPKGFNKAQAEIAEIETKQSA